MSLIRLLKAQPIKEYTLKMDIYYTLVYTVRLTSDESITIEPLPANQILSIYNVHLLKDVYIENLQSTYSQHKILQILRKLLHLMFAEGNVLTS